MRYFVRPINSPQNNVLKNIKLKYIGMQRKQFYECNLKKEICDTVKYNFLLMNYYVTIKFKGVTLVRWLTWQVVEVLSHTSKGFGFTSQSRHIPILQLDPRSRHIRKATDCY